MTTGGPASSGSAVVARSASFSEARSRIAGPRSTARPVSTSVASGWKRTRCASTASQRIGSTCS